MWRECNRGDLLIEDFVESLQVVFFKGTFYETIDLMGRERRQCAGDHLSKGLSIFSITPYEVTHSPLSNLSLRPFQLERILRVCCDCVLLLSVNDHYRPRAHHR